MEDKVSKAIDIIKDFNESEWSNFLRAVRKYVKNEEKYYINPISTINDASELQKRMVQLVIDFINEKKLTDITEVQFNADGLDASVIHNEWTPMTDSYLALYGVQEDDGKDYLVRKLISEIC